jgi:hypothetical protein
MTTSNEKNIEIKNIFEKWNNDYSYKKINDDKLIDSIYDLFINKEIHFPQSAPLYLWYLGVYYDKIVNNAELSLSCWKLATELKCIYSPRTLGNYYKKKVSFNKATKYYLKGVEINDEDCYYEVGKIYRDANETLKLEELCTKALDNKFYGLCNIIGYYHQYSTKKYELMEKYYLLGIENNILNCMANYGKYMYDIKKNEIDMKKYYRMGISNKSMYCSYFYATYFKDKGNTSKILKYYLKTIEFMGDKVTKDNSEVFKNIVKYDNIEIYDKIYEKNIDFSIVSKITMTEYNKYSQIKKIIDNKIKYLAKEGNCPLCMHDSIVIPADCCAHFYCRECYSKLKKCAQCYISATYDYNNEGTVM